MANLYNRYNEFVVFSINDVKYIILYCALTTSVFFWWLDPNPYEMSITTVYMKKPTKMPEATISASGFFSSFKFHVPPTPKNPPRYPVRYRTKMIMFNT